MNFSNSYVGKYELSKVCTDFFKTHMAKNGIIYMGSFVADNNTHLFMTRSSNGQMREATYTISISPFGSDNSVLAWYGYVHGGTYSSIYPSESFIEPQDI